MPQHAISLCVGVASVSPGDAGVTTQKGGVSKIRSVGVFDTVKSGVNTPYIFTPLSPVSKIRKTYWCQKHETGVTAFFQMNTKKAGRGSLNPSGPTHPPLINSIRHVPGGATV